MWTLLVDFGLVILIWMTQLIVYPGFTHMSPEDLVAWHPSYTTAISVIVMPLMLAQVGLHGWDLLNSFSWIKLLTALLIAICWANTFFQAVPLHNQIGAGRSIMEAAEGLVKVNWYRTILWSIVFVITAVDYLRSPVTSN